MNRRRAVVEVTVATAFWGYGFIATRYVLEAARPFQAMVWRFALATAAAIGFAALLGETRRKKAWQLFRTDLRLAFFPGVFLASTISLQALGLELTSVANNSFLTCLYIVFVPVLQAVLHRHRVGMSLWFCVALALVGAALMCGVGLGGLSALNVGDLYTIACAMAAAFHILWIDRIATKTGHAFWFNVAQAFWAGVLLLPFALIHEGGLGDGRLWTQPRAVGGLLFLALASTLVAFMLQIRSQRVLKPAVASMLFLLEGPFATVFAWWWLGESASPTQLGGAGLVLLACALSVGLPQKASR